MVEIFAMNIMGKSVHLDNWTISQFWQKTNRDGFSKNNPFQLFRNI